MTTHITTLSGLQDMNLNLAEDYILDNDIDAAATSGWNAGAGFLPIGDSAVKFTGSFDGGGFTISNLVINRSATNYIGLFGYTNAAKEIKNLTLTNVSIVGASYTGGLFGVCGHTTSNCHVSGAVTVSANSKNYIGGFAGSNSLAISGCDSNVTLTVADSCSSVGGFVGYANADISQCFALGSMTGGTASGDTFGSQGFGGFVGYDNSDTGITNCYSRVSVTVGVNSDQVGGFVGWANTASSKFYSTGSVSSVAGADYVGGLVGRDNGGVTASYWDTQTSGQATSDAGTGKTTAEMKTQATFTGWDFSTIWRLSSFNDGYPAFEAIVLATAGGVDLTSLEAIRNIEMSAMGRFYIDEEGNAVYESRFARNA